MRQKKRSSIMKMFSKTKKGSKILKGQEKLSKGKGKKKKKPNNEKTP